jgi:hypothetical protein
MMDEITLHTVVSHIFPTTLHRRVQTIPLSAHISERYSYLGWPNRLHGQTNVPLMTGTSRASHASNECATNDRLRIEPSLLLGSSS